MEERAEGASLGLVGRVILLAIGMALAFYVLVILSAAVIVPWETMLEADLPVASALDAAFNRSWLTQLVLVAGLMGILTTWNAIMMIASRILLALGRARMLPAAVARVHPTFGSPAVAVLWVAAISIVGVFLGRSILVPIVNIGATCLAFAFIVSCWGVVRLRHDKPDLDRPYRVPGGVATAWVGTCASILVFAYSLYEPFATAGGGLPVEWAILGSWGLLGILFWCATSRLRNSVSPAEQRQWILGSRATK
jgi:amino acid transporter